MHLRSQRLLSGLDNRSVGDSSLSPFDIDQSDRVRRRRFIFGQSKVFGPKVRSGRNGE
jgi:hypothetical protein